MALTVNATKCPQNHYCPMIRVCPIGAISQDKFGLPIIDEELCTECGKCTKYCPMRAVEKQ
jgi:Fe-S-cluster-containing hydrogenase component 2